jgi:hypothetical protein
MAGDVEIAAGAGRMEEVATAMKMIRPWCLEMSDGAGGTLASELRWRSCFGTPASAITTNGIRGKSGEGSSPILQSDDRLQRVVQQPARIERSQSAVLERLGGDSAVPFRLGGTPGMSLVDPRYDEGIPLYQGRLGYGLVLLRSPPHACRVSPSQCGCRRLYHSL